MNIDGMEWMDWLHKMREKKFEEAKKAGLSFEEYLEKVGKEADEIAEKYGIKTVDFRKIKS